MPAIPEPGSGAKKKKIMGFFSCYAFTELLLFVNFLFSEQQKLFCIRKTSHIYIYVSTYITTHVYIHMYTHFWGNI